MDANIARSPRHQNGPIRAPQSGREGNAHTHFLQFGGLKEPRVKSSELRRPTLRARLSVSDWPGTSLKIFWPLLRWRIPRSPWRSDARASVRRSTASPRWSRRPHRSRPPSATDGTDATARTGGGPARRHRPPRGSTETCRRVTSRPRRPPCRIRGLCSGSSPERPRMSSRRPTARRRSSGTPTATPTARRRLPPRRSSSRYRRRTSSSRRAAAAEGASPEEAAGEAALDGRARSGAAEARGPDGPRAAAAAAWAGAAFTPGTPRATTPTTAAASTRARTPTGSSARCSATPTL